MTTTGSWSMKLALVLAVAALVWAGAASIAVGALEGRLRGVPLHAAESPEGRDRALIHPGPAGPGLLSRG